MKQVILTVDSEFNVEEFWQNDKARNLWAEVAGSEYADHSLPMSAKDAEEIMKKFREIPGFEDDPNGNKPFVIGE